MVERRFANADNARLPRTADQKYTGLRDGRVRRAFEAGLDAVLGALGG